MEKIRKNTVSNPCANLWSDARRLSTAAITVIMTVIVVVAAAAVVEQQQQWF
jgi:hypothetical protein